jgi:hypothetical protein
MWNLYDYVDTNGKNDFKEWTKMLEKKSRARLNLKLDMLKKNGPDLSPGLLSNTHERNIMKIRVNGSVALRPMLCRGPVNMHNEFTLLLGVIEKDRKLKPKNAESIAENRRKEVQNDPMRRRCNHERVDI